MNAAPRTWRRWTAILAAYALVLQVMLAGLAAGAMAAPAASGDDGFVLCLGAADPTAPPSGGDTPAHKGFPDCCTAGCPMLGSAATPPPDAASLPPPDLRAIAAVSGPVTAPAVRTAARTAHPARAPPV